MVDVAWRVSVLRNGTAEENLQRSGKMEPMGLEALDCVTPWSKDPDFVATLLAGPAR